MTSTLRPLVTLVLALALATSCRTAPALKVSQSFPPGTDFKPYRTFSLVPADRLEERFGKSAMRPEVQRQIEAALQRELVARGLQPAQSPPGDLWVAYFGGVSSEVGEEVYGYKYDWSGGASAHPAPIQHQVESGWLTVDLVDARTGDLVWRGKGEARNPDAQVVDATVAAILAQYPPAKSK